LGIHYSKLYAEFGTREFYFEDAQKGLGVKDTELRAILSGLRRSGFLDVLARHGRRRVYRIPDPAEVMFLAGKGIDLRGLPEVIRPALRSYLKGLFDRYESRVVSVVLYGSFSMNKYNKESDIDLLVVIDDYKWEDPLCIEPAEDLAFRQWELERRYHKIQPFPLRPEQARYHRPIYLDMTVDGQILYDRDGFITKVFEEIRRRLAELGAKRYELPDGSWYWVLKPEVKEGEVFEI
jgi:predicted nucleotidyltransferase